MPRFADPLHCPSCGTSMSSGTRCEQCGVSFVSPQARQLWATLNQADELLAEMEGMAAVGRFAATTAQVPPAPTLTPSTPQSMPLPQAPPLAPRPKRRSWSVGTIILVLGALCILAASFVFVSIAWFVLGQIGRTIVLLLLTAAIAVVAAKVTQRGLRASAETMWAIVAGMATLDFFAARAYGLFGLDQLSWPHSFLLFGVLIAGAGLIVARRSRSMLPTPLVVAQVVAVGGTYSACAGVRIDGVATTYVALVALVIAVVPTGCLWLSRLPVAAAAAALAPLVAYVVAVGSAAESVWLTDSASWLWAGPAWTMVTAVAVTILLGIGLQTFAAREAPGYVPVAGTVAATIATAGVELLLYAPFHDLERAVEHQLVIVAFGVVALTIATPLAGAWGNGARIAALAAAVPLAATGIDWILGEAVTNVARSASAGQWADPWNVPIVVDPQAPPGWLAAVVLAGVAVSLLLIARWPVRPHLAPPAFVRRVLLWSAAAFAISAPVIELAVNALPVIALAAVLAGVAALLLLWPDRSDSAGIGWAGIGMTVAAVATPLASASASMTVWGSLVVATALAASRSSGSIRRRAVHLVLAGSAATLLLGSIVAATHTATLPIRWQVFALVVGAVTVGVGAQSLRTWPETRWTVEAVAAAAAIFALSWATADTSLAWQSLLWTIVGACLVVVALISSDRRLLAAAGSAGLAVAYILRLAASDIDVVEAYTLPIGTALLIAGCVAMALKPALRSWTAIGAGLTLSLLPTLPPVLDDPTTIRGLLLGLAAVAVLAFGLVRRWQAPFVLGAALTALLAVRHLGPVADAVPRWMLIGTVGVALLLVGITWESRVKNAKSAADYVSALR